MMSGYVQVDLWMHQFDEHTTQGKLKEQRDDHRKHGCR